MTGAPATGAAPRPGRRAALLLAGLVLAAVALAGLGAWQLQRLQWKLALIDRVTARVSAPAVEAPAAAAWRQVGAARDEYRRVRLRGHYLAGRDTRVQAVTGFGGGYWILSPFRTRDGDVVLVNRGFAPPDWRGDTVPSATEVTGLLRMGEPGGAFLRRNEPAAGRWYSRDVDAIARARGLGPVAPFFVDLEAPVPASSPAGAPAGSATLGAVTAPQWPRAGLTVVRFRNHHLGYALTWFVLALMSAGAAVRVARDLRGSPAPRSRPTDGAASRRAAR